MPVIVEHIEDSGSLDVSKNSLSQELAIIKPVNYDTVSISSICVCPGCQNKYNNTAHIPKVLSCSHTMCLQCCSRFALTCPTCRNAVSAGSTNQQVLDILKADAAMVKARDISHATCSECQVVANEKLFVLCVQCCKKNPDDMIDLEQMTDADYRRIEWMAICSSCVLQKHNTPYHKLKRLIDLRIRRDCQGQENIVQDITKSLENLKHTIQQLPADIDDINKLVNRTVSLMSSADSSTTLHSMQNVCKQVNEDQVGYIKNLTKLAEEHHKTLQARAINLRNVNEDLLKICVAVEEPKPVTLLETLLTIATAGMPVLLVLFELLMALFRIMFEPLKTTVFEKTGINKEQLTKMKMAGVGIAFIVILVGIVCFSLF